ncbi:MAG: ABC transporter transmembrane domain-containing protein [Bacillota bacterium]|nr:ABC transporter transmembrane domain-containing protein [Bacillota bacterium]
MLLAYARKYSRFIVAQLFFASIWVVSQLLIPCLMVGIVDLRIMLRDMDAIVRHGLLLLLATVINILALLVSLYFMIYMTAGVSRDLRADLFERIIDCFREARMFFPNFTPITRTLNSVRQVSKFLNLSLRILFTLTITVIGAFILSFLPDARLALIILLILPAILLLGTFLTTRTLPQHVRIRQTIERINLLFWENIRDVRVIRASNRSDDQLSGFEKATQDACQAGICSGSTMMLLSPLILLLANILLLLIWHMGGRAETGTIRLGVLIGLLEYAVLSLGNILKFAVIITTVPRSKVSIDRIAGVLIGEKLLTQNPDADRIMVMDNGTIVEAGSHQKLFAGMYGLL